MSKFCAVNSPLFSCVYKLHKHTHPSSFSLLFPISYIFCSDLLFQVTVYRCSFISVPPISLLISSAIERGNILPFFLYLYQFYFLWFPTASSFVFSVLSSSSQLTYLVLLYFSLLTSSFSFFSVITSAAPLSSFPCFFFLSCSTFHISVLVSAGFLFLFFYIFLVCHILVHVLFRLLQYDFPLPIFTIPSLKNRISPDAV